MYSTCSHLPPLLGLATMGECVQTFDWYFKPPYVPPSSWSMCSPSHFHPFSKFHHHLFFHIPLLSTIPIQHLFITHVRHVYMFAEVSSKHHREGKLHSTSSNLCQNSFFLSNLTSNLLGIFTDHIRNQPFGFQLQTLLLELPSLITSSPAQHYLCILPSRVLHFASYLYHGRTAWSILKVPGLLPFYTVSCTHNISPSLLSIISYRDLSVFLSFSLKSPRSPPNSHLSIFPGARHVFPLSSFVFFGQQ